MLRFVEPKIKNDATRSTILSVIVDATPDILYKEQTAFMMRRVLLNGGAFEVKERFFQSSDCNVKTAYKIANMIIELLEIHEFL